MRVYKVDWNKWLFGFTFYRGLVTEYRCGNIEVDPTQFQIMIGPVEFFSASTFWCRTHKTDDLYGDLSF